MSGTEAEAEQADEAAGESGAPNERAARLVLAVVAILIVWGIVTVFPDIAYVIVGILLCRGWDKARAWQARRQAAADEDEQQDYPAAPDVAGALRSLAGEGRHVLLTELRDAAGAADTKAVRALLDELGVPVRPGVRTPAGNGPGVHKDDLPAPLPDPARAQEDRCSCRSTANANTNNDQQQGTEEGLRVQPIGIDGKIVYDLNEPNRHHRVKRRRQ